MDSSGNKKILLIANSARSMVLFRLDFIAALIKKGFEVVVCVPHDAASIAKLESFGAKVIELNFSRCGVNIFSEFVIFYKLLQILKKIQPQICILYTIKPVIYGSIAAWFTKIKNIYSMIPGLGYVFVARTFKKKILAAVIKFAYRIVLRSNKKVFFLNQDDLAFFLENKLILRDKWCLLCGEGVNLEKFSKTNLPANITFLFAARLLRDKGIYEYIAAAREIKKDYSHVKFLLAGALDDNPSSIKKEELDVWIKSGVIEYLGYLDDIRGAISQASVFVLPSYREGLPISIVEAMAMGRPIITTDAPGCRDTVVNDVNGFLVPVKNSEKLVFAMRVFINNPEEIQKMSDESRRLAETKFDVNAVNAEILQVLACSS